MTTNTLRYEFVTEDELDADGWYVECGDRFRIHDYCDDNGMERSDFDNTSIACTIAAAKRMKEGQFLSVTHELAGE